MKIYQWLSAGAALAITALQVLLFTSASSVVSPLETRAGLVPFEAAPADGAALQRTGGHDARPSRRVS